MNEQDSLAESLAGNLHSFIYKKPIFNNIKAEINQNYENMTKNIPHAESRLRPFLVC